MNAKKIMGAVLVALLAAALFVGAGAADDVDIGVVTTYTGLTGAPTGAPNFQWAASQTFIAADGSSVTTIDDGTTKFYFPYEGDALNKKYSGYGITFTLVAPNAVVAALNGAVNVIGMTISEDVAETLKFTTTLPGAQQATSVQNQAGQTVATSDFVFINEAGVIFDTSIPPLTPGKWGVAAVLTGKTNVNGLSEPLYGQFYYFTVSKTGAEITAVKDTVNVDQTIVLKIEYPGAAYAAVYFDDDYVDEILNQAGVTDSASTADPTQDYVIVTLDQYGAGSVAFKAADKGKAKFTLSKSNNNAGAQITDAPGNPKVTVTIEKGVITAVADEDSYFTGNPIGLSGTTTAGKDLFFYIEGQNFKITQLNSGKSGFQNLFTADGQLEVTNGEWTAELKSLAVRDADKKKLVAGTYTVIVSTYDYEGMLALQTPKLDDNNQPMGMKDAVMDAVYGTAAVKLTQPFITDVKADAVAIQENDFEITGTAYSADDINVYIFGYNYFLADEAEVDTDEETFEYTLKGEKTKGMAPGTYFYLLQHPMGDKVFNVWNGNITSPKDGYAGVSINGADADFFYIPTVVNANGAVDNSKNATFIFNAYERGTNYAAQALLDEIAKQQIDDTFVQGTFEIAPQKMTINPIPAEVAQGTALTVSGTSNCGEGTEVIVNILEGTFGATTKGDENVATFLTEKAVTKADGTWEAAFDTSKLETGDYTVTVELKGTMYDSANVKIVEAAAPEQPEQPENPEQPEQPEQPTEPETPGFGALAALAGLGAVAVLLLRRE